MTRAEQPTASPPAPDDALVADSRERAVRALLRRPQVKRLWSAQLVGGVGDVLALLVLTLLVLQASVAEQAFGGGYRGAAFAVATVLGVRILATLLFGAVLLGPLTSLTSQDGPLDRRWTMVGADGLRVALLIVAPLWIDWTPGNALAILLVTAFVAGVAERFWTVSREGAAPALLPGPPPEGASIRPLPDHLDALRRLSLRTGFVAIPLAALTLVVAALANNLLGTGIEWFGRHQAALASYVAAGLFAASLSVVTFLELPGTRTPRPRSPLEGLRRPRHAAGPDKGRTGALPLLVVAGASVAGAVAAAVAVAVLHAKDLGGGPVLFGLMVGALTGGVVVGIRTAPALLPSLSRRRMLALTLAFTGLALLAAGLVPDVTSVLLILALAGVGAGMAANIAHTLLDQETEEQRRSRVTEHLHAVVRVYVGLGAVVAPVIAAAIGPHRLENGKFVFAHGGAAFTLMLVGALLLPVAALVLAKVDDRSGVPLRQDLRDALLGGDDPAPRPRAPASSSPWRAATAPASPPRPRLSPTGSAPRATRSSSPASPARPRSASGCARSCSTSPAPASRTAPRPCSTRRTARSTWTPSYARRWSAARSSSATATSTPPSPTRAPDATCRRPRSPASTAGPPPDSCRT